MPYKFYFDKIDAELLKISPRQDIMLLRVIAAVIPVALFGLDARYGLPVPETPWPGKVERYASLQEAFEAGIAAEIANAEIYEWLLQATERQDILTVFRNLHEASQQRHLPAFQRYAQGSAGRGGHGGRERRQGKYGGGMSRIEDGHFQQALSHA